VAKEHDELLREDEEYTKWAEELYLDNLERIRDMRENQRK
jgi:hypothetical protein